LQIHCSGLALRATNYLGAGQQLRRRNTLKTSCFRTSARVVLCALAILTATSSAHADVVTDANAKAADIASQNPAAPIAARTMAIVQVSVFEAVNAIAERYPALREKISAPAGASVDAAVVAATRTALLKLMPGQQTAIDADYQAAMKLLPESPAKADGVAVGERAANATLASSSDDGAAAPNNYRPYATAGVYVPTQYPAVPHWGKRRPWVMTGGSQFRPGPPPLLTSEDWTRDFNEVKAFGAKNSTQRSTEQTAIAQFWEATSPAVYWPLVRSVATMSGRDVPANARLLAAAGIAMDDAVIAVFDAKYTYNFWRPITAIRNADLDGNDGTALDPGWVPFIDTPMHPEYPCAHCIVSAALGAVLEAEIGDGPTPKLSSASSTAGGAVRSWDTVAAFVSEVAVARIYDGVHYRNSAEVGSAMGKKVGELVAQKLLKR
jgi:PAP2 superfamily